MPGKARKFERCGADVATRGGVRDPAAVCAASLRRTGWPHGNPPETEAEYKALVLSYGRKTMIQLLRGFGFTGVAGRSDAQIADALWTAYRRSLRDRANPADSAAELSEAFHGRETTPEYVAESAHVHTHLAGLGTLREIKLRGGVRLTFDKSTRLASNEAGSQMFVVGGDQTVDLAEFPEVDATKEAVVLGQVRRIVYVADKQHLGREDKRTGPYSHTLGEESGDLPVLIYRPRDQRLEFAGGHYYVGRGLDGGLSEGVVD